MHTRRDYTVPEAMAVMSRIERLMVNLATRISEDEV